jgi:protein O-GlcNAc transferase
MLDTFPVNAHTTASDALWAGIPIITVAGASFTSRVATSLVEAAGLRLLSVASLEEYVRLAIRLGTDPGALRCLKRKVAAARRNSGLFDTALYVRQLEAAYLEICARGRRGDPPAAVRIS